LPDQATRPAVFLDRDGVINRRRLDHVKSWSEFEFLPNALDALRSLHEDGATAVVVTNQSAIGRGLMTFAELDLIHRLMLDEVRAVGGEIAAVYSCPHVPDAGCSCRKPATGLLELAADELRLSLSDSVLVGDSDSDVGAARSAGCQPVLVSHGSDVEWRDGLLVVHDLLAAVAQLRIRKNEAMPC
jgi:D-glycero-D-manno-heptose 1,7-bisphosphate phosphatase